MYLSLEGNAGKLKELLYNSQEPTRETVLRRSSMITLTYHLAHCAFRPEVIHRETGWTLQSWPGALKALHGCCMDLFVHGPPHPPCSSTMSRTTKGFTGCSAAFREDWTGSWASQHWAVLRQVSLLSGSADVRWKASGHLSDVLFTQRKHQGLLTNGNSLSPKLPGAATTSFFCLKGCTHD